MDHAHGTSLFDGCGIVNYLLCLYDRDQALAPLSDAKFATAFYQFSFYASGTLDNLTATSSPIQMVIEDKRPGDKEEVISKNMQAFKEVCGPLLARQLDEREFMYGNGFTALDVVLGYSLISCLNKREDFMEGFPTLKSYALKMKTRPAYIKAIS